jgi:hypothetical protein
VRTTGARPAAGSALLVEGAEVSAVRRVPGGLEVRLFRSAGGVGRVTIDLDGAPARGFVVDLRGRPVTPFEREVTMRPWELVTVRL